MAKRARPAAPRKPVKKASTAARGTSARPQAHSKPAPRPKPHVAKAKPSHGKAPKAAPAPRPVPARAAKAKPVAPRAVADPGRKAVEIFERGFRALQQRQYGKAAEILTSLVTSYPEEKELHERARVFLAVCERQAATAAAPRTFEDRLCAATLALNRGEAAAALELLQSLDHENPEHDHVQYLLAIAHCAGGNSERAVKHLRRAIELRPSNRVQAGQDVDLEALRGDPSFHELLGR